ncbi:MAG: DUF418 domain-containing protein, partial [Pontixanthobacter sp.]
MRETYAPSPDVPGEKAETLDQSPKVSPTSAKRIQSLDFLRGIAVMGILFANIVAFGQSMTAYIWPTAFIGDDGDPGGWWWIAQFMFVDGKMRGLFTLLFGAGMILFMQKAWARGDTRWLQLRRLAILLIFGLLHFYFIWKGDILFGYAVIGALALLFIKMQARNQLILGLIGFVGGGLLVAGMMVPLAFIADTQFGETPAMTDTREGLLIGVEEALASDRREAALIQSGDYGGYVANNFAEHGFTPLSNAGLFVFETLPFMLIGMALYQMGFFSGGFDRRRLARLGWGGVIAGIVLSLPIALWVKASGFTFYGTLA